jgi:hypothetical protein
MGPIQELPTSISTEPVASSTIDSVIPAASAELLFIR